LSRDFFTLNILKPLGTRLLTVGNHRGSGLCEAKSGANHIEDKVGNGVAARQCVGRIFAFWPLGFSSIADAQALRRGDF
jgi:hypothetical protein